MARLTCSGSAGHTSTIRTKSASFSAEFGKPDGNTPLAISVTDSRVVGSAISAPVSATAESRTGVTSIQRGNQAICGPQDSQKPELSGRALSSGWDWRGLRHARERLRHRLRHGVSAEPHRFASIGTAVHRVMTVVTQMTQNSVDKELHMESVTTVTQRDQIDGRRL